jgi:hypothetical protein
MPPRLGFIAAALLLAGLVCIARPAVGQERDAWERLRFLVGKWSGEGGGRPGEVASSTASFELDLGKKILVRKNRAEFAPKPGEKAGAVHEDLMIVYPQPTGDGFRAIYFDSEGHVIHYTVSFAAGKSAVFESDGADKGPRFRIVYEPGPAGTVATDFQIAPPGGELKSYVKGVMKRAR